MIVQIMGSVIVVVNASAHHNLEEKIVVFYNYHLLMDHDFYIKFILSIIIRLDFKIK